MGDKRGGDERENPFVHLEVKTLREKKKGKRKEKKGKREKERGRETGSQKREKEKLQLRKKKEEANHPLPSTAESHRNSRRSP